ncbi:DNA repair protein XRCC4 isoform X1 [Amaranthus tricolor]|uniref:DNA repair protein XRCC4 isoform X1 n=1 Tax=Amaranthus tricolor TaxID=29722 RepID=UPI002589B720|nr:DNA repair protein XRCC4 isoform X1 [Amaranthus tricolor]
MVTSTSQEETYARESCLKLEVGESSSSKESIFVKGTWFPSHFFLLITNGAEAWLCNALEEDVKERASQWDQSESEYVKFAEKYLGFQQPDSVYRFSDAGNGFRKLSWTFEKEGIKLEWRWRCKPSPNCKKTTAQVLDFLMDSNINLSEEVIKKTEAFEQLKEETQKCLVQSEKLITEKQEFESEVYAKFVNVLNSKKAKLRELRDRISKLEAKGKLLHEEDDVSTDGTEPYHTESDEQ